MKALRSAAGGQGTGEPVTALLRRWSEGDRTAAEEVLPRVYDELRRIARICLRRERRNHTLEPTAVVHETFLRLCKDGGVDWRNRDHFFAVAARLMRRVLVDYSRERNAAKRGGGSIRVTLEEGEHPSAMVDVSVEELDDALAALQGLDAQKAAVVELRFFGGLTIHETAAALETSPATVVRQWRRARAWLFAELRQDDAPPRR